MLSFLSSSRLPLLVPNLLLRSSTSLRSRRFHSVAVSALRSSMAVPRAASTTSMAGLESEVALGKKLWIKFRKESLFAMFTPFAVCLASGNLKVDTFRHYLAQDVYFLNAFVKAYELAEECADDDEEKVAITQLRKDVLQELKMHDSFALEWASATSNDTPVNPATLKYTDFLLATASGKIEGLKGPGKLATPFEKTKIAAYTIGAMTPCMRLYAFLGNEFQTLLHENEESHPYKKWIDIYSSQNFQASAMQIEDLLDKLSVSLTGEELDIIEKLYHQAMKLEIEFFTAQSLSQPTIIPLIKAPDFAETRLVLFSDFDLTCTVLDSSAILAEIAIVTAPKSEQHQSETQIARMPSSDLRKSWDMLSKQYTDEYEECIENVMAAEKVEVFNHEALVKELEKLSSFEKKANTRVIESGVLKGLDLEDIKRAGERMILQDGCTGFFQKLIKSENMDVDVHVLSYCWCGDLIRAALLTGDLQVLNIHANELCFEESLSTGEIVRKVESPLDKLQTFRDISQSKDTDNDKKNLTVYIGDSVGDLLCLLEADIGIVIGTSASLRRVGTHFGVSFVPLFTGLVKKQKECSSKEEGSSSSPKWNRRSGTLYTVSSWTEVHAFILGW